MRYLFTLLILMGLLLPNASFGASTDASPFPQKNTAFRVTFTILDNDGDLVTGAAGLDSECSCDAGADGDCTSEGYGDCDIIWYVLLGTDLWGR